MPNRIIRDSARTSPSLAALSDLAERTFWRVIAVLDDFGRYHGTDLALLAAAYPVPPAGLTPARFAAALLELESGDLLRFYEVGGRRFVYSPTWSKYQRLRARDSQFPQPPQNQGGGHRAVIAPPSAPGVGIGIGVGNGTTPPAPLRGVRALRAHGTAPEGFDQFWNAYPASRRRGRQEAIDAWRRLKLTPAQVLQVMASLESWKQTRDWQKADGKYIPWPQKFLNKRRWEETVEPERSRLDDILGEAP